MSTHHTGALPANPETATLEGKNKVLGFWLFLGAEVVLFGCLFATYIALRNQFRMVLRRKNFSNSKQLVGRHSFS